MRTLLLAPGLFSADGGIERMMRLYLKAVCDASTPNDAVALASLHDRAFSSRLEDYAGPALQQRIAGRGAKVRFSWRAWREARRSDRVVCGHLHLWPMVAWAQRFNPRLRTYLVAHGIEVWRPWTATEQRTLARATGIWAVSAFTRERVLEQAPQLAPERVHVLPNALDPTLPLAPAQTRVPGRIVTVARLSRADAYKGIDHLIEALPLIRRSVPTAHVRVVGWGDDLARLRQLAAEHAPAHVDFVGPLGDRDLCREFSFAQAFALPSRDEGFGLVYLEALAHGSPCVAAASGGAPEVVQPDCGRLAPFGDRTALAAAAIAVLQAGWDPPALRATADRFSYQAFRDRLETLLAR